MAVINGTGGDDTLSGTSGDDTINGLDGNDTLGGDFGDDLINGGAGNDDLRGGPGNDALHGDAGDDMLDGWDGNDLLDGGAGADYMSGGPGDDTYVVDSFQDQVVEFLNGGTDTVRASISYTVTSSDVENLILTGDSAINGFGNPYDNTIIGNDAANRLYGGAGSDVLIGGGGDDQLSGDSWADTLTGGAGNDTFLFRVAEAIFGDTITDFSRGDRIVISDATLAGFTSSWSAGQLSFTGGSMTLSNLNYASIAASAAPEGGVQIAFSGPPIILSAGASVSPAAGASASAQSAQTIGMASPSQSLDQSDFLRDRATGWHAGISHWDAMHLPQADLFPLA